MKEVIIDFMSYLGVSTKYEGYKYMIDVTLMINRNFKRNEKLLLTDLYKRIAKKFNISYKCVEKNIRTCIEGLFKNGNIIHINEVFENISYYYDDRPSNKLFFTTIINYLNK